MDLEFLKNSSGDALSEDILSLGELETQFMLPIIKDGNILPSPYAIVEQFVCFRQLNRHAESKDINAFFRVLRRRFNKSFGNRSQQRALLAKSLELYEKAKNLPQKVKIVKKS